MSTRGASADQKITGREGFEAMIGFLTAYWERGGKESDEMGGLLGALAIQPDGISADPALWDDWLKSVDHVLDRRRASQQ